MALTKRTPPSDPGYDTWTQQYGYFTLIGGGYTSAKLESGSSYTNKFDTIHAHFTLAVPANDSQLTVGAKRFEATGDHFGYCLTRVILKKPDTTEIVLYSQEGGGGTWENILSLANITAYLNAAGTYELRFEGTVKSAYDDPGAPPWYHSYVEFGGVTLKIDTDPPAQVTGHTGYAQSTSKIHYVWNTVSRADSYTLYYRKTGTGPWFSITGITDLYRDLTGLDACTYYDTKVTASNESGEGTASTTAVKRTNCAFTKDFLESLGLTEAFDKGKEILLPLSDVLDLVESFEVLKVNYQYKEFLEPLDLQEYFTIQKISPLGSKATKLLACLNNGDVTAFETGTATGSWETDDLDFGRPGQDKILDYIEFVSQADTPHTLNVYVSTDSGATWTYIGQDVTYRGKNATVSPWMTAEKFRIRFTGAGLHLQSIYATAIPVGEEIDSD